MKKFLAIVMCLTMALAMMTVTSFAATVAGNATKVEAEPGAVVEIPVYATDSAAEVTLGIVELHLAPPANVEYEVVPGVIPAGGIAVYDAEIVLYDDSGSNTYSSSKPAATLKVTAPAEAGVYTFAFIGDNMIFDENFDEITDVEFKDIVLEVKAPVVEGDPVMTVVPAETGTSLMVLEPVGTPVEMGVVYQGEGEYNGVAFKSLAPAGAKAAVKVIGLEGTFAPYANY
jgi:hypothetical protein